MTAALLLAPAGTGKTAHAVARVRALPPLAPVRVLVPGQLQAEAFRRRLAAAGGALGVEIQTFYDLYADVLAQAPDDAANPPRLPPPVRYRLLRHLVERACDAGELHYYAPLRRSAGFARLLGELFAELKRVRVFPETLEGVLGHEEPRLSELARLYTAYQSWLVENGWVDAEGQGWLAALALENESTLLGDLALLVVDGFDEFNPTQLHVLRLLGERAAETLITLTGDPDRPERLAHRRLARARAALTDALDVVFHAPTSAAHSVPPLAHLEAHLFESDAAPAPAEGAVTFLEAQNRAAEAREALRWLKARLVRDALAPSDVAVVARDVTPYRPFLEEVAAEFGLPLHFNAGAPLHANPVVAALLNLLTLPLEPDPWMPRALLDALTSPYFDWSSSGLQPGDARRLHDVALAGQVVGGRDQWRAAFRHLATRAAEEERLAVVDEEELAPRPAFTAGEVARLRAVFEALTARVTPPEGIDLHGRVRWLEQLVGEEETAEEAEDVSLRIVAGAREHPLTAARDTAALRALKDVLRGLVLAEAQFAREGLDTHAAFVTEFIRAVESATYSVPVEGDAILALSAPEARGLTFDAVALLGLAEGDFPRAENDDVLLRDGDRARLAARGLTLEPQQRGDEATFFYQAVTRVRRHLLLTRPYLADDGQAWEPSPYWSATRDLFEDAPLQHIRPTDPVRDPASAQERAASLPSPAAPTPETSPGDLSALSEPLAQRFGPERAWSSSKLETYAKCPHYFWAAYVMELEPEALPEPGFDVLILGSIYHLVLERLYARVPDGDPDRLRAELDAVAREVYATAPDDYGFRPTPLWERQQEELTETLRRTLEALIEAGGDYVPLEPELAFGLQGRPPLVIRRDGITLQLRGYIDRVDRAADGKLRIIDYKAGSTPISPRDLVEGTRLQLPLYALAAQEALGESVDSGFYWHISSAEASSLKLERFSGGVAGAIETAVAHALSIVEAVRAGEFAPAPPSGGCPRFCPAAVYCEEFKPKSGKLKPKERQ
ncbi:MAG: PD-(D/E)XK nuclease family protein [Anaerolineae bacterium]